MAWTGSLAVILQPHCAQRASDSQTAWPRALASVTLTSRHRVLRKGPKRRLQMQSVCCKPDPCSASTDGDHRPIPILDNHQVCVNHLVRVHKDDRSLIERICPDASTFHEGAARERVGRFIQCEPELGGTRSEGTYRPRITGKYEFSTSMTCWFTVLLPTCAPREGSQRVTAERTECEETVTCRDGPSAEVRDPGKAVKAGRRVFRNKVVLLGERARHVARAVARFHLWRQRVSCQFRGIPSSDPVQQSSHHHANVLHRSDRADERSDAELCCQSGGQKESATLDHRLGRTLIDEGHTVRRAPGCGTLQT